MQADIEHRGSTRCKQNPVAPHLEPVRVLHVAETCKGGVGSAIRDIANGDGRTDFRHTVLHPEEHSIPGLGLDVAVETYLRGSRNLASLFRLARAISTQVEAVRPHIVHAHSTFAGLIVRLMLMKKWMRREVSVVYTAHGWSFDRPGNGPVKALYMRVESALSRLCDRVICLSRHELVLAKSAGISEQKIRVIYNAHPRLDTSSIRRKTSSDEYRVLFVGRFDYQKGFDILLESISLLKGVNIRFTLIGEAVRDDGKIVAIPADVEDLGWQSPEVVYDQMSKATVLVVPSRWEGFALAPLEAMCVGTPVLSSSASSLPEAVVEGISGKRFESGTASELAAILKATSKEEWQAIGEKAQAFCRRVFSPDAMLTATYQLYSEVSQ